VIFGAGADAAALLRAAEAIGTIHYSRFIVLSERTVLFLADFDGELEKLLRGLAQQIGPALDAILEHVDNSPPTPVANNAEAFIQWATAHNTQPAAIYTAYPKGSVQEIKSRARAAGIFVSPGPSRALSPTRVQ
jgi:hypothetical protein